MSEGVFVSSKRSPKKSIHKLKYHDDSESVLSEVIFTFVAQLFLSLGVIILFTQIARAEVMSFQDWKKMKVTEAQSAPAPTPSASQSVKPSPNKVAKPESSRLALEIAEELTIEDYFALYLSQFKDHAEFTEAAKKLSPSEMGDLLLTLKNSLDRSGTPETPQNLSYTNLNSPDSNLKK